MNVITRPPVSSPPADRGPDDLDRLLSEFFRAELPDPWPSLPPPAASGRPPSRPWLLFRSRFTLAASVALLLIGSLSLVRLVPGGDLGNVAVPTAPQISSNPEPKHTRPVPRPAPVILPDTNGKHAGHPRPLPRHP